MGVLIVVGLVVLAVGAAFVAIGVATARGNRRFEATAARADAVVTDVRSRSIGHRTSGRGGGLIWIPVVRFRTADGRTVDAEAGGGTNVKRWEPGQPIQLLYDPADPTDVRVPGTGDAMLPPVFKTIGGTLAVIGMAMLALALWI